jgi:hypothetical protein
LGALGSRQPDTPVGPAEARLQGQDEQVEARPNLDVGVATPPSDRSAAATAAESGDAADVGTKQPADAAAGVAAAPHVGEHDQPVASPTPASAAEPTPASAPQAAPPKHRGLAAIVFTLGALVVLASGGAIAAWLLLPDAVSRYLPAGLRERFETPAPAAPSVAVSPELQSPVPAVRSAGSAAASAEAAAASAEPAGSRADQPPAKPFDHDAARHALGLAAGGASTCRRGPGPARFGQVEVTFAPEGHATAVRLTGELTVTNMAECVKEKFRQVRVPAFSGDPVTVDRQVGVPALEAVAPKPARKPAQPEPEENKGASRADEPAQPSERPSDAVTPPADTDPSPSDEPSPY